MCDKLGQKLISLQVGNAAAGLGGALISNALPSISSACPVQERNSLHVRRVRKHVDWSQGNQPVPAS
eukprot:CAMPEP_0202851210 /NCGR_PEP_ID=MMETSP1389-20130828/85692_1 /ASSEMBLY_ACC=CAM_ASM_000865 /TAXON_ID=302021 /ORGANISM="Rhodomonas sp., Strain CCMP768" /LENGTH=66 /DNA_ID=CAMNT_0049529489 /DNA_START=11 /DNA_END=207 /DNA_ORIENTATION=+